MTVYDWIELARDHLKPAGVEGLEFYDRFVHDHSPQELERIRAALDEAGFAMPMMCYSPDFTHPDPVFRSREIEKEKAAIDLTAALGGTTCRVLSGQRRPDVSREDGVRWTVDCIEACLPHAEALSITLAMENHYKDGFWKYPEFAQKADVFLEIIGQIDHPRFGVNYDPSNALVAGDDPLWLLEQVKERVVSMHASDRYLKGGSLEDLRQSDGTLGYSPLLSHGVIGEGLNDYDRIFEILRSVNFIGWISIEDGVDSMQQMVDSAVFLSNKIDEAA
ncbi:MAG: sugar phosphate isomerase/epimerase [Armatimonadetes bacterium]|nr:sugar phosphate isomerase/epimerase [Armatimonadota bacterium]